MRALGSAPAAGLSAEPWRRRIRSKRGQGRLAHDGAPLHAAVLLGRRERVRARELGECDPAVEARCFGASDRERVEPDPRADPTRVRTAVAERQGDHAVRHSGEEPDGELERAAGIVEADPILVCEAERFGRLRADERGVVPGQLGEGIGKLLQPPVVREAAVVKRGGGEEDDLQATAVRQALRPFAERAAAEVRRASSARGCPVRVGTTSGSSLPERNPSCRTRFHFLSNSASPEDRFPGLPHDVVAGTILAPDHQPQHFDGGSSAEQGEDQRLDDAERASNRARVSPRFEVMRAGNVPRRLGRMFRRPCARARSTEGPSPWPRRSRDRRGHRIQDCRPGRRASLSRPPSSRRRVRRAS